MCDPKCRSNSFKERRSGCHYGLPSGVLVFLPFVCCACLWRVLLLLCPSCVARGLCRDRRVAFFCKRTRCCCGGRVLRNTFSEFRTGMSGHCSADLQIGRQSLLTGTAAICNEDWNCTRATTAGCGNRTKTKRVWCANPDVERQGRLPHQPGPTLRRGPAGTPSRRRRVWCLGFRVRPWIKHRVFERFTSVPRLQVECEKRPPPPLPSPSSLPPLAVLFVLIER